MTQPPANFDPSSIKRPDPVLMKYYALIALLTGPAFPITIIPLFLKYATLTYAFDDSGVSMKWGVLFRHEVYLTYRRIQDIQLNRNLFQRWFGLATIAVQTASGASTPEMSIEGVLQPEVLRDYLYSKMRGFDDGEAGLEQGSEPKSGDQALQLLTEIRDGLRLLAEKPV